MTLVQLLQQHGASDDKQIASGIASASLGKMMEVGVRRRGRQQDARAACASMQAVGVCDVRAWRVALVRTGGMSTPTLLARALSPLTCPARSLRTT